MNNEGLEFLAKIFPPRLAGIARGATVRALVMLRAVKTTLFTLRYPLPVVLTFSNVPPEDLSLQRHPVYGVSRRDALRSDESRVVIATFGGSASRACRRVLAAIRRQPAIGYFRVASHSADPNQVTSFEEDFIKELSQRRLPGNAEPGRRAMVLQRVCNCPGTKSFDRQWHTTPRGTLVLEVCSPCPRGSEGRGSNPNFSSQVMPLTFPLADEISRAALMVNRRARPPVVFVPENSSNDKWFFGLGDVVLGAALTHQSASAVGRLTVIDWSRFSGGQLFVSTGVGAGGIRDPGVSKISQQINSDVPLDIAWSNFVFTNRRPKFPIGPETRAFLLEHGIGHNTSAQQAAREFLSSVGLERKRYFAAHVRFGDSKHQKADVTEMILAELQRLHGAQAPILLLSDKPELLVGAGLDSLGKVRLHRGMHSGRDICEEDLLDALTDLELLGQSQRIFSFSRYAWGSGFAQIAGALWQVPVEQRSAFRTVFAP